METKYIFRTKAEKEYTVIKNSLIADKSLSWEARGLVIYLLSKPDTWIVMKRDLIEASPAAGKKISSILKELETVGYIKRNKFRNKKGQWEWHTWVYDVPNPPPIPPKRGDGSTILPKTTHGETTHGKGVNIVSTELKKTKIKSNEKTTTTGGNIFNLYEQEFGAITPRIAERLKMWEEDYPEGWIEEAINISVDNNIRKVSYAEAILERWRVEGKGKSNAKKSKQELLEERISAEPSDRDKEVVRQLREEGVL